MNILSPGVIEFEDVFLQTEELIDLADAGPWRDGVVGKKAKPNEKLRITDIHDLEPTTELHTELLQTIMDSLQDYSKEYPINITQLEGLRVAKYPDQGFYKLHIDAVKNERQLSMILFLNSDFEGGELYFKNIDLTITPKAGTLIIFPSNFLFQHECKLVNGGEKYIGLTWAT